MEYDLDKVRAIPILDVAEKLGIEVEKQGNKYWARCLWHTDNHPSMVIGGNYNNCHCYSCGESKGVIDLVMQHENLDVKGALELLAKEYPEIIKDGDKKEGNKLRRMEALIRKRNGSTVAQREDVVAPVDFTEWVKARMTMDNSFVMCLKDVFGEDDAARVVRDYRLCSVGARFGVNDVGFPLIDVRGVVRDVKVQGYQWDKRSDRYFHGNGTCYWLGGAMHKELVFDRRCLFGEHLLNVHADKVVVLVESPKNACVGSARYPELMWVAAGNKGMLNREVLQVLKGRRVVVFPDRDAFEEWRDKLSVMGDLARFKVLPLPEELGAKGDIADWILSKRIEKDYFEGKPRNTTRDR